MKIVDLRTEVSKALVSRRDLEESIGRFNPCPKCGSTDTGLMPPDFETIKCAKCGKCFAKKSIQKADCQPFHDAAFDARVTVKVSPMVALILKALMPSFAGARPVNHAILPPPAAHAAQHYVASTPGQPSGASEHPTPAFETNKLFGDGNGNYHPSRKAFHDDLIHRALNGGMGKPGDVAPENTPAHEMHKSYGDYAKGNPQRHGIFLMGGGGSGKGYYKTQRLEHHPRFVNIDPDEIKEHLAHHDNDPGGHNTHPECYHEESSDVAKRLHAESMKQGKSFIYDGTGAGKYSLEKKLKDTKSHGYKTSLHYVLASLHTARERNQNRARKVPEHVLIPQHAQVTNSFAHNRKFADKIHVIHSK